MAAIHKARTTMQGHRWLASCGLLLLLSSGSLAQGPPTVPREGAPPRFGLTTDTVHLPTNIPQAPPWVQNIKGMADAAMPPPQAGFWAGEFPLASSPKNTGAQAAAWVTAQKYGDGASGAGGGWYAQMAGAADRAQQNAPKYLPEGHTPAFAVDFPHAMGTPMTLENGGPPTSNQFALNLHSVPPPANQPFMGNNGPMKMDDFPFAQNFARMPTQQMPPNQFHLTPEMLNKMVMGGMQQMAGSAMMQGPMAGYGMMGSGMGALGMLGAQAGLQGASSNINTLNNFLDGRASPMSSNTKLPVAAEGM